MTISQAVRSRVGDPVGIARLFLVPRPEGPDLRRTHTGTDLAAGHDPRRPPRDAWRRHARGGERPGGSPRLRGEVVAEDPVRNPRCSPGATMADRARMNGRCLKDAAPTPSPIKPVD